MINPVLECSAGYYCRSGAETATPMEDSDAYECPRGYYCPIGTVEPIHCPEGTYSNNTRLRNETDCSPCTEGWYCDDLALNEPKAECDAGYYCPSGSVNAQQIICPAGRYV